MSDELIFGHAFDGKLRFSVAKTTKMVDEARCRHDLSPLSTVVLGRLMTGAILSSPWLAEREILTLILDGDGPVGRVVAQSRGDFTARGYVSNPKVETTLNERGKFDVAKAVGKGTLTVVRDLRLKYPIVSKVPIVSGEIAQDLSYYFTRSEQIPTSMALGVLVDKNGVKSAGGFAVQVVDRSIDDEILESIETKLKLVGEAVSSRLDGSTLEEILDELLGGNVGEVERVEIRFRCDCTWEKAFESILVLPLDEIVEMKEKGFAEVVCKWCGRKYYFNKEDLERAVEEKKRSLEAGV